MPTVPSYDHSMVDQQGLPSVRVSTDAPIEAFGGGRSLDAETQAGEQLASTAGGIAQEEKQKADQVAYMETDQKLSNLQTQLQVQTNQMLGKNAASAPDVIQQAWQKGVSDIAGGASNTSQKMFLMKAASDRWDALNRHVQEHVGSEMQKYDDQVTSGYLATSRQNITLNADDGDTIASEMDKQKAVLQRWAERKGLQDSPAFQEKMNEELSTSSKSVIEARLDSGDNDGAKEFFEAHKDSMTAQDIVHANKMIENADVTSTGLSLYDKVKNMTLSDGSPDEDKMRAAVLAETDDMSAKRQLRVWDVVKGRANEDFVNANKQQLATDRSFMNAVLDAKKQGVDLSSAMKLAEQYSIDEYDQATKEEAVRRTYAPPTESNPAAYIAQWERVQQGNGSRQDIDLAFQNGQINAKDWRSLREEYLKSNVEGKNPEMDNMMERVKALAESSFGSDKQNNANFMYEIHQERLQGKSPDDLWKSANDKLKGDPSTGIFGFFQKQQWKTDLQRNDAENLAWGSLHQDVGKDVVTAIGKGILSNGKEQFGLSDIDAFAANFGGYDKIKSGTPANNAMQALMARNKLVTPEAVETVLSLYPDGKVPQVASR